MILGTISTQTKETQFKQQMIETPKKNLVFEGGGSKGLVYAGALQILEANGMLEGIVRVAGSSPPAASPHF